ncbi:MAG TPA: GntR family transcriptional regulator [Myxococcaceae bacterium]|jgi:DNA-binding FadR family transcriptional regulator
MERVGLVAQVEAELEKMLAQGLLPPDGKMPSEHGLARCFKVSRGTVREALRSLSAKGLIVQYPGRRTQVVGWDEALTLENLSVALPADGQLHPGQLRLLEGFLTLKRDLTMELLVACGEKASPAELEGLSQATFALADAARWDTGDGRWVQQEFALLRQAACAVDKLGHVLLIQSLERAFRGMAKWVVPHLDTGAVQEWAWCAFHALAEKNVQGLKQKLPALLQAGDEHLLRRLASPGQPLVQSKSQATVEPVQSKPPSTVEEPHPGEPAALEASQGDLPERVVPNLSNSRTGLCEVPTTGGSSPEPGPVEAGPGPEFAPPWQDWSSACCGAGCEPHPADSLRRCIHANRRESSRSMSVIKSTP